MIYGILDECFEGEASLCFCRKRKELLDDGEDEQSETLYSRKNVFKEISFLGYSSKRGDSKKRGSGLMVNRWSDCGCESCASWMKNGDQKLHVIVREPSKGRLEIAHFTVLFLYFCSIYKIVTSLLTAEKMVELLVSCLLLVCFVRRANKRPEGVGLCGQNLGPVCFFRYK